MKTLNEFFAASAEFWNRKAAGQHGDITPGTPWTEGESDARKLANPLLELVPTTQMDVVEIGCGEGRLSRHLADRFRSYTGVDVCGTCISRAEAVVNNGCKYQL